MKSVDITFRSRARRRGLRAADLVDMYNRQSGRCKICGVPRDLRGKNGMQIDHCWRTGDPRGMLCTPCNNVVMHLVDKDPGRLLKASVYKDTSRVELSGVWDGAGLDKRSREYKNARSLYDKHGINIAEHEALYRKQGGGCALCGEKKHMRGRGCLQIDHCHDDGHVRGLLCLWCNINLMRFIDSDKHLIFKAFEYKARKPYKRTYRKPHKLVRLARAKKDRCVVSWSQTDLCELIVLLAGRALQESEVRKVMVELFGHENRLKLNVLLARASGIHATTGRLLPNQERFNIERLYRNGSEAVYADKWPCI